MSTHLTADDLRDLLSSSSPDPVLVLEEGRFHVVDAADTDEYEVSAGIVCFEVAGLTPGTVVDRLKARRIRAVIPSLATRTFPFPLDRDRLLSAYRTMRTIREFEDRLHVDFSRGDPGQQIKDQTGGEGTDKGVDAVGYQAVNHSGDGEEPATEFSAAGSRDVRE